MHYSLFAVLDDEGWLHQQIRVNHAPKAIKGYLSQFPEGTPVAIETVGNWYWIVDETCPEPFELPQDLRLRRRIEEAGCIPKMAHAAKVKSLS